MDRVSLSRVPWTADIDDFIANVAATPDGACCFFGIEDTIPAHARAGYATLVIAYARESEPVTVLADGSAYLLIREGGTEAGQVVAERILQQMAKIGLRDTLRAAVSRTAADGRMAIDQARSAAASGSPGTVTVAR